jgi:hypothetical protein
MTTRATLPRLWDSDKDCPHFKLSRLVRETVIQRHSANAMDEAYELWNGFATIYHDFYNNGCCNLPDVHAGVCGMLEFYVADLPDVPCIKFFTAYCASSYDADQACYDDEQYAFPEEDEFEFFSKKFLHHLADKVGLLCDKDEGYTKHQTDVIRRLKLGQPMFIGWNGVAFAGKRCLMLATEKKIKERFGDQVRRVSIRSPRFRVPGHFVCLADHVTKLVGDDTLITCLPWK